jgi:cytochrome c-type biogenesis protein CcmH
VTLKVSYAVMGIVLVVALALGTRPEHAQTADDRAQALEETIKCPVCRGQSVAQSDSEASKNIRIDVARRIANGESDQQIQSYYEQTLGADILLKPPASGWGGLVWVLPVVAFVAAGAGIGYAFWRWRRWA